MLHHLKAKLSAINPQLFQTTAIGTLLLVLGKLGGFVSIDWLSLGVIFAIVLSTDYYLNFLTTGEKKFPFSAINSGIGIGLFLRGGNPVLYGLVALGAILSKYLVRDGKKHFYNPSYSVIFLALIFFPGAAYTNPLQWGSNPWILGTMLVLGSLVMWRVKEIVAVIAFFVSFIFFLHVGTEYSWDTVKTVYLTGSFFIVAFFGLTDPATLPKANLDRVLFITKISALFFILRLFINENYALFASYFVIQTLEMAWHFAHKYFGTNSRICRWASLIVLVLVWGNTLWSHQIRYNGAKPQMLNNRCPRTVICDPFDTRQSFHLLKPVWTQQPTEYYQN